MKLFDSSIHPQKRVRAPVIVPKAVELKLQTMADFPCPPQRTRKLRRCSRSARPWNTPARLRAHWGHLKARPLRGRANRATVFRSVSPATPLTNRIAAHGSRHWFLGTAEKLALTPWSIRKTARQVEVGF